MAIRHTREMSIQSPDPEGLGLLILAAPWSADACVVGSARSLTHLQVRSLACSPSAFASTRPGRRFSVPCCRAAPTCWAPPDAGYRDRGVAVGGRGEGQDDRFPGRAGGDGRALPGWRQRRPHGGQWRRGVQAPVDAVGRALSAHHVGHRQRRRRQPGDAHHRARHARRARDRRGRRPGQPQRARDHAVPHRARSGQRGPARRRPRSARPVAGSGRPTAIVPGGSACAWRTSSIGRSCTSGSSASCPTRTSCSGRWAGPPSPSNR